MASESPRPESYADDVPQSALRPTRRARSTDEGEAEGRSGLPWYIGALQRRWILALAGAALGGALFFGLAGRQPPMYEGVTTLLVVPPSQAGGAQVNPATFRAIAENATLASQIIEELKLQGQPHDLTPQKFVEDALAVTEVKGTNVVKIVVTLSDPRTAAEASRRLAQKAVLMSAQINDQERDLLQEQLNKNLNAAHERLQQAEQELLSYQQSAQIGLVEVDTTAMLKARGDLLRLAVDVEAERARLAAAELEIKRQQPLLGAPRVPSAEAAIGSRSVPRGQIDPQRLDLTNPFVNPVYQTLEFQIAMSRTRIAALETERKELINRQKVGGAELVRLSDLYRRRIEQARLEAKVDIVRRVYGDLALRYEQSRTTSVGIGARPQILDEAQPLDRPLPRKRLQKTAFGSAAGFVFGVLLIFLWEGLGRRQSSGI